tara:strand:- start:114 stop:1652 length:1539 start_codon:yes stop_codon:yes gene_type:complete
MSVHIHQLSKELGISDRELVLLLKRRGFKVRNASNTVDKISAQSLIEEFRKFTPFIKLESPPLPVAPSLLVPSKTEDDQKIKNTNSNKNTTENPTPKSISLSNDSKVNTNSFSDIFSSNESKLNALAALGTLDARATMQIVCTTNKFDRFKELSDADKTLISFCRKVRREFRTETPTPKSISLSDDSKDNTNPFSDIVARDWLANALWKNEQPELDAPLILIGDGPFEALEFAQFLNRNELDCSLSGVQSSENPLDTVFWPYISSINPPIIVIGSENFRELELLSLLSDTLCGDSPITEGLLELPYWIEQLKTKGDHCYFHRSKSLKDITIVSQEMLLACLFGCGSAPADLPAPWPEHMKSHPVLGTLEQRRIELKKKKRFPWPTTDASDGDGSLEEEDWPDIGLLKHMGYTVGKSGESRSIRHQILTSVFELTSIPKIDSPEYVKSWGTQRSASRLRKMAESIAAFARNNKRSSNTSLDSVGDWEDDLAWLEIAHYRGKFNNKFTWPRTSN